jgi:hypothetical protein
VLVRIRKIEVLFVVVPVIFIGALLFSLVDAAKQVGAPLTGQIRKCSGGRGRAGPRMCIVDLSSHAPIEVDVPFGRIGNHVTIVKMQKSLSGASYYAVKIAADPLTIEFKRSRNHKDQ